MSMNETQLAILRQLSEAWDANPEQRFGQLIENVGNEHREMWSPADEDWLQAFKRWNERLPLKVDVMFDNHTFLMPASAAEAVEWLTSATETDMRGMAMLTVRRGSELLVRDHHRYQETKDSTRLRWVALLVSAEKPRDVKAP